jgi:hypothetical protein
MLADSIAKLKGGEVRALDSARDAIELVSVQLVQALILAAVSASLTRDAAQTHPAESSGKPRSAPSVPLELPDSAAARAYAASPPGWDKYFSLDSTVDQLRTILGAKHAGWTQANTWAVWSQALRLAARPNESNVSNRAMLAELALGQSRWDDAWSHFIACDPAKDCMSALLPRFIPGVTSGYKATDGPLPEPLPDGIVLHPSLPPPSEHAAAGRIDARAMKVNGFVVGKTTLAMRVAVEAEGVQIDVEHRSGETAHISIVIPEPKDWSIGDEYVDWAVQPTHHQPLAIEVKPGDEPHTIYGRFQPRGLSHPTHPSAQVPAQLEGGIVWLLVPSDQENSDLYTSIAKSLGQLPLHLECRVTTSPLDVAREESGSELASGITIDLRSPEERDEKLAWLVSSLERICLAPDSKRPR